MGPGEWSQISCSLISQISVFVAGAAYCWFEPITLRLSQDPELSITSDDVSWIVANIELGCVVSPMISAYLTDRVGRKLVLMSIGPLSLAGWILVPFSMSKISLNLVRIFHGLCVGVAYTVQPIYTAEIAEPGLRGRLSGSFQTLLYFGTFYVFCVGPYLDYSTYAYICLPFPVIFMVLFVFCPETPYYHLMRGREEEARKALRYFRDTENIDEELAKMKVQVKEEMSGSSSWRTLFFDKNERKSFIIVEIVCLTQFLTGIPIMENYAVETFAKSESFLPPSEMSIILAVFLIGISVLSAFLSDRIGRKPLLLVSCFGSFLGHFLSGLYYYLHEKTSMDTKPYVWLLYFGIIVYCFFSGVGLGPLLQTLQSEMFGANTRGLAGGITGVLAAVFCFSTLKAYTPVNDSLGVFVNFWFYSGTALFGGLLLTWLMYETAGKPIGSTEMRKIEDVAEEGVSWGNFK